MSPYLIAALIGVAAAILGSFRNLLLGALGGLASLALLGYYIYLVVTVSFGTAVIAFLASIVGATIGVGLSKLPLARRGV